MSGKKLTNIPTSLDNLPDAMRKMETSQRLVYLNWINNSRRRGDLQIVVAELHKKGFTYLTDENVRHVLNNRSYKDWGAEVIRIMLQIISGRQREIKDHIQAAQELFADL